MQLHRKKKVEIVVEAPRVHRIIELLDRVGAKGYTVVPNVSGKGHRGVRSEGDIFDVFRNVLVIVVATEPVARRIMEESQKVLENYAGVVYMSDVEVVRESHF